MPSIHRDCFLLCLFLSFFLFFSFGIKHLQRSAPADLQLDEDIDIFKAKTAWADLTFSELHTYLVNHGKLEGNQNEVAML